MLFVAQSSSLDRSGWKLDCAASQHICQNLGSFKDYSPFTVPKLLRLGKAMVFLRALGKGTVELHLHVPLTLTTVWYCPDCPFNLLSTARFVKAGHSIRLTDRDATISSPGGGPALVLEMERSGLYCCQPGDRPAGLALPSGGGLVASIVGLVPGSAEQGMSLILACPWPVISCS